MHTNKAEVKFVAGLTESRPSAPCDSTLCIPVRLRNPFGSWACSFWQGPARQKACKNKRLAPPGCVLHLHGYC